MSGELYLLEKDGKRVIYAIGEFEAVFMAFDERGKLEAHEVPCPIQTAMNGVRQYFSDGYRQTNL